MASVLCERIREGMFFWKERTVRRHGGGRQEGPLQKIEKPQQQSAGGPNPFLLDRGQRQCVLFPLITRIATSEMGAAEVAEAQERG